MKKFVLLLGLTIALSACSSHSVDEPTINPTPETSTVYATLSVSQTFSNGTTMTVGVLNGESGSTLSRSGSTLLVDEAEPITSEEILELSDIFLKEFVPGKKNLLVDHSALDDFSADFNMISNGRPFTIYPVLVGGDARNILGISCLVDGEYIDYDIIDLTADEVIGNAGNGWTCLQSGEGVTVQIPKGMHYQFYIYNSHRQGTPLHGGKFYSNSERNYNNQMHAVTFGLNNCTFIGFEDLDLEAKQGVDFDYNDLILMITPRQKVYEEVIVDIPIDIEEEVICDVDDFALSNNVERYPEHYNIGGDADKKITVHNGDVLSVKITDFENLDFDEEYREWTYETWIWLDQPAVLHEGEDGRYLIGDANSADYSYSKGKYNVGVNAYMGNQAQGTAGYIKVSVHVSCRDYE